MKYIYHYLILILLLPFNGRSQTITIDLSSFNEQFCQGDTRQLYFTATGPTGTFNAGNVFQAQLSNAAGSFSPPTIIGTLTGTTSGSINITIPQTTFTGTNYRIRIVSTNTIQVSAISPACTVSTIPIFKIGTNAPVCEGDTLIISGPAIPGMAMNYVWTGPNGFFQPGAQLVKFINVAKAYTGLFTAYGTNTTTGCTYVDTTTIVIKTKPAVPAASSNSPICQGDSVRLSGNTVAGATYSWSAPGFSASRRDTVFSAKDTGRAKYVLAATVNGCTARDTINVIIPLTPYANIKGNGANTGLVTLCEGKALSLEADTYTGATYNWTGPGGYAATTASISIDTLHFSNAGYYYVNTILGACNAKDTVQVQVLSYPVKPVVNTNSPVCKGDTVKVDLGGNTPDVAYIWSGLPSASFTDANKLRLYNSDTGVYRYPVMLGKATCFTSDTITVTVKARPVIIAIQGEKNVVAGSTANLAVTTLTNNAGMTIRWSGPEGFTSTERAIFIPNLTTKNSGFYKVIIADNGCTSSDSAELKVVTIAGFSMYPVPNNGTFTVKGAVNDGNTAGLQVSNAAGQVLYMAEIPVVNKGIDYKVSLPAALAPGIYYLRIKAANQSENIPFLLVH